MDMLPGQVLKFIRTKEYTFQRDIGQGGTGKTILVKDEVTDFNFVCKKYSPYDSSKKTEFFSRFIDEIKIMYLISHKNIVRIYNYYLYPENTTGFILMEYIDGNPIDEFLVWQSVDIYENIFVQLIEGFEYLERNKILHRDIRNSNILVTNDGIAKIIDFGFGKKIEGESSENASILLNWPVTEYPEELKNCEYNHQTELYFVGKLFSKILEENGIDDFKYQAILDRMIISNPKKRISSFSEILQLLSNSIFNRLDFSEDEKKVYRSFADELVSHVKSLKSEFNSNLDIKVVLHNLEKVIEDCVLERYLQDNSKLIRSFINIGYVYLSRRDIEVSIIVNFYKLLKDASETKQRILMNNLLTRIKTISVVIDLDDDLPF